MLTSPALSPPDSVVIESLTISRDVMPHHYIARTVILDLEPPAIVAALGATLDRIRERHPRAVRTGWTACNDGLRIYFYAWSATVWPMAGGHHAG
jgi:hypothetical protein